ncbi:hypothetical protein BMS3Abin05_02226 [bacterium BMS3Abin05]|nr:hypothetical protein BMS3Abin05_02226 [bacterium BMS3Abin05]GBE26908.1 hypothetical protein BMS3Bbin03_00828 [bacterium BMS3Bbin03]
MHKFVSILVMLTFSGGTGHLLLAQKTEAVSFFPEKPLLVTLSSPLLFKQESTLSRKPIPPGKAFLQSLLLPGWGEWNAGAKNHARAFWVSEGILGAALAGFQLYGAMKAKDYKAFAAIHAGALFKNKPKRFVTNISYYQDILEYNEYQRRLRRYDLTYPLTEENWWEWDSGASRKKFNQLRIQSETAYRNAVITLGVVFMNHVISGIDAIWTTRQHNKKLQTGVLPWKFETVFNTAEGKLWAIQIQRQF